MSKRFSAIVMPSGSDRRSVSGGIWSTFRRLARSNDGVSAIEFALLAPMLVFALLATIDVGRALTERMTIDHVLRAGAQKASSGGSETEIDQVMRATAAKNFTVAAPGAAGDDSSLALKVSRVFACAEQPATEVDRSTTCSGSAPTQIFYKLSGEKSYPGVIFGDFLLEDLTLSSALRVQVR